MEIELEDGSKIKFEIPGSSKNRLNDFINLINMIYLTDSQETIEREYVEDETIYGRIYHLILKEFGLSTFSLGDLYRAYLIKYGETIKKSTLSTYLMRLLEQGYLKRIGTRGKYRYKLIQISRPYQF